MSCIERQVCRGLSIYSKEDYSENNIEKSNLGVKSVIVA